MTTRPVRGVEIAEVDEAAVASYLAATPEFFDRHAQLLAKIRLPDMRSGASTVSLLERQVEVLRERNRELERKVKDFVEVARENDVLGTRVLAMARRLIAAKDHASAVAAIESALREEFGAGQSVLVLTAARAPEGLAESRFLRIVPAEAPATALVRHAVQRRQAALRPAARFAARVPVRGRCRRDRLRRAGAARRQGGPRPARLRLARQPALQPDDEHGFPRPHRGADRRGTRPGLRKVPCSPRQPPGSGATWPISGPSAGSRPTPRPPTAATSMRSWRFATARRSPTGSASTAITCAPSRRASTATGSGRAASSAGCRRCAASSIT